MPGAGIAKHRQMPEDPTGYHGILTARAGKVQIQVQGWGRVQGVDLEWQGRQQGEEMAENANKKKQAKYCPKVPKGSRHPNRRALWPCGSSNEKARNLTA